MLNWRTLTKAMVCTSYKFSGLALGHEVLAHWLGRHHMVILLFHRVSDAIPEDGMTIGTERFRRICRMLKNKFRVVPLEEVFAILRHNRPVPRRTVALTFDDCYRDDLGAARLLAEHGLPAAFFLPTAYVGTDEIFPWDRDLPPLGNLTWDNVRELSRLGFEIGSHTATHPDLSQLSAEEALRELVVSKKAIESQIDQPVRWFAYPFGGVEHSRPDLVELAEQAGYQGCLSGYGGFIFPGCHNRLLPREAIPAFHSLVNLELHLAGCLEWYYALRRRLGWLDNSRSRIQYQERRLVQLPSDCVYAHQ